MINIHDIYFPFNIRMVAFARPALNESFLVLAVHSPVILRSLPIAFAQPPRSPRKEKTQVSHPNPGWSRGLERSTRPQVRFQNATRALIAISRKILTSKDHGLEFRYHFEIWHAFPQLGCGTACQISKRYQLSNIQSHSFEISRYLRIRTLVVFWNEVL